MKKLIIIFILLLGSTAVMAHNKVVVIPMAGDDAKIEPFAPVAKDGPPDADYTIKPPYTTVIDNITGREWQRADNDAPRNWNAAWFYCKGLSLDGKEDWRLPSVSELISIVSYDLYNPAINGVAFLSTKRARYWSASTRADSGTYAWRVDFVGGRTYIDSKTSEYYVRCVRSNRANGPVLQDNNNGTVTDLATGLIWQQEDDNDRKTLAEAQSFCSGLTLDDKSGWRVPNIKELTSINEIQAFIPAIDEAMFPSTDTTYPYWSASSSVGNSAETWQVYFEYGYAVDGINTSRNFVRCVH